MAARGSGSLPPARVGRVAETNTSEERPAASASLSPLAPLRVRGDGRAHPLQLFFFLLLAEPVVTAATITRFTIATPAW